MEFVVNFRGSSDALIASGGTIPTLVLVRNFRREIIDECVLFINILLVTTTNSKLLYWNEVYKYLPRWRPIDTRSQYYV